MQRTETPAIAGTYPPRTRAPLNLKNAKTENRGGQGAAELPRDDDNDGGDG